MSNPTALVLGCGYVGLCLTRALRRGNVHVVATTRSTERKATLEEAGAEAIIADVMDPPSLKPLAALAPDAALSRFPGGRHHGRQHHLMLEIAVAVLDGPAQDQPPVARGFQEPVP